MSDLKISDIAKQASREIAKQVEMQDDPSVTFEHIVQSAINKACRPLVQALEDIGRVVATGPSTACRKSTS